MEIIKSIKRILRTDELIATKDYNGSMSKYMVSLIDGLTKDVIDVKKDILSLASTPLSLKKISNFNYSIIGFYGRDKRRIMCSSSTELVIVNLYKGLPSINLKISKSIFDYFHRFGQYDGFLAIGTGKIFFQQDYTEEYFDGNEVLDINPSYSYRFASITPNYPKTGVIVLLGFSSSPVAFYTSPSRPMNRFQGVIEYSPLVLAGSIAFAGGACIARNGKMYALPCSHTHVVEIDPIAKTAVNIGNSLGAAIVKFGLDSALIMAPNGKLYAAPSGHTNVICVDPVAKTVVSVGASVAGNEYTRDRCIIVGSVIFCFPFNGTSVLEIDTNTNTLKIVDLGVTFNGNTSLIYTKEKLYILTDNGKSFVRGDVCGDYQRILFYGKKCFLHPNGNIYGNYSNSIYVINTHGNIDFFECGYIDDMFLMNDGCLLVHITSYPYALKKFNVSKQTFEKVYETTKSMSNMVSTGDSICFNENKEFVSLSI